MAVHLRSWNSFLDRVRRIRASRGRPLLFRGQSDAGWKLETTLERRTRGATNIFPYYRAIARAQPEFEAFSGRSFDRVDVNNLNAICGYYDEFSVAFTFGNIPNVEYLVELRHHGFPSPLLDWTRSPYVASYFAFATSNASRLRALYVWEEPDVRGGGKGKPQLTRVGSYLPAHRRHFVQQCDYTICPVFADNGWWQFAPHNEVLRDQRSAEGPLWKFTIPSSERLLTLQRLDEMNVNAFTLFGTDDALAETLASREIDMKGLV